MSYEMSLFHRVDDHVAILRSRGRYRQVPLYRRGKYLYAGLGGAYVRLQANGGTSDPNVGWIEAGGPVRGWLPAPVTPTLTPPLEAVA